MLAFRQVADFEKVRRCDIAVVGELLAVDGDADEFQFVTIEYQGRTGCSAIATLNRQRRTDDGFFRFQGEVQFRLGYGVRGRTVIFETECLAGFSTHSETLSLNSR